MDQSFLPKDREGALNVLSGMLYGQLCMVKDAIEVLEENDPEDPFIIGKLIAYKTQRTFLQNTLDIIERS